MSANFSVQFRINEKTQTRVIRLTDTSSGFTLAKGNFSVTFPDGSTRIKTEWTSPDITSPAAYIDILAVTDTNDNVITGAYKIDFIALDAATTSYSSSKEFDFNWVKPTNLITDLSDVLIPQVQFKDNASYSPIGSFTGTPTRVFSVPFPTTSEASAQPATTTSTNTLTPVYTGNYYEGVYNVSNDISCDYTHSSSSWLTINYVQLFTKTVSIKKCPTQLELIGKINTYRGVIEAYKEKNDTQFNLLSEQYDLAIALYSHIIARYETGTQDGSEGQLRELLSILEPYTGSYTYQSTKMLQFELASSGANSFNITDGTNTDSVALGSTVLFSSGNASLVPSISNNQVTFTPVFGSTSNTFAQGNDTRFHNAVTIGTANGLSLASQVLSLALATTSTSGAFSASDKAKLDGIAAGANTGTVTSIAISVPSAFAVSNSPVTTSGTINISATGNPLQYITGAGALATLNTSVVPELTNLYFTNARARAAISVTGSLAYNSSTGVISYTTPSETDPIFLASAAYGITSTNISNWNTAYGWGNHASAGYLTSITSSEVTTALGYTPENAANKGIANGYASLDGAGLVPSTQLPSYVDDVLEYADLASLPATGTTGKIYVTLDTNKIYRWSGTVYVEISSSAGGGGTWGSITGTLSNQTDLQAALDAKQNQLNGTGFVKVSGTTITYDNSTYYPQPTGTTAQYITGDGTLATFPSSIASASQMTTLGRNSTGATLYRGTVVYISGSTGNVPNFSKAQANGEGTSARTFGIIKDDIANNSDGLVVSIGAIDNLDTRSGATHPFTSDTLVDGDTVYLDPTTAGYITRVKPTAPNHLVYIGKVIRTSPTNGAIVYQIQNGFELDELHDVQVGSYVNKDVLYRDTATNLWKNASIATVLGYTPYDASNPAGYTTNVGTVTSVAALTIDSAGSDITSSVADGTTTPVITLSVPDASTIARGVVNNGTQTFGGAKTFSGNLTVQNGTLTSTSNTTLSSSVSNVTVNIATGTTISGSTKTINIGTAGLSGSTTNITIGSTAGTNTVTARGTWTFAGNITAATIIKSGGTSSEFLKADGSVDTSTYLTSYTETDPIYTASSWYTTTNNSSNWDTAYGWGNHASAGYLTTSSAASTYQPLDADLTAIAGLAGTSGFLKKTAANTWSLDTSTYLTSYTETDPIYVASSWYSTTNNASNWNTAYGWGNHASAGYLTSITSSNVTTALGYTPVTNARTITINGTTYDLSADRSWTVSGGISGSGTTSYIPKFTGSSAVGNSAISDNGTNTISTAGRNLVVNQDWSQGGSYPEQFSIIGSYASMCLRNTGANYKWLFHNDSSGVLRWYGGASWGDSTWTNLMSLDTTGNLTLAKDLRASGIRLNGSSDNRGHRIYSRTMDVNAYSSATNMRFTVASGNNVQFQYEVTFHATRLSGNLAEIWYLKYTGGVVYNTGGSPNERWWDLREQAGNGIAGVGRNNNTGNLEIHNSAYDTACRLTCVVAITCNNWDAVTVTFS